MLADGGEVDRRLVAVYAIGTGAAYDLGRVRRREPGWKRAWRRYRLPVGLGAAAVGWYAADSLSHRREGAFGYQIEPDLEVSSPDFLRAAEALTAA